MSDSQAAAYPRKSAPTGEAKRPSQVIGKLPSGTYPIFCHEAVLDAVIEFSERDLRNERGGFLLGGVFVDSRPYVEIQHFVPAQDTVGAAASMRFTHETWAALNRELSSDFPESRVVGWQHTHPGLGIFLSHHDRFIHRHFFDQPWHVAMVVDPRQHEFGFFQWRERELVDTGVIIVPQSSVRVTTMAAGD